MAILSLKLHSKSLITSLSKLKPNPKAEARLKTSIGSFNTRSLDLIISLNN